MGRVCCEKMASLCGSGKTLCSEDDDNDAPEAPKPPKPSKSSSLAALLLSNPKKPKTVEKRKCSVCVIGLPLPILTELQDYIIVVPKLNFWSKAKELGVNFKVEEECFGRTARQNKRTFSTAAEYGAYFEEMTDRYKDHIVEGGVERIDETDKVIVTTKDVIIECSTVIYDAETSYFSAKVVEMAKEIENVRDASVVLDGFSDAATFLLGQLVLQNNEVHMKSSTFYALDSGAYPDDAMMPFLESSLPKFVTAFAEKCCAVPPAVRMRPKQASLPPPASYWPVETYFTDLSDERLLSNILLNDIWFFDAIGKCRLHTNLEMAEKDDKRRFFEGAYVDDKTGKPNCLVADRYYKLDEDEDPFAGVAFVAQGHDVNVKTTDLYKGMLHPKLRRIFFCGALRPHYGANFALLAEAYRLFYKYVFCDQRRKDTVFTQLILMTPPSSKKEEEPSKKKQQNKAPPPPPPRSEIMTSRDFAASVAEDLGFGYRWHKGDTIRGNIENYLAYVVGPMNIVKLELLETGYQNPELLATYKETCCPGLIKLVWAYVMTHYQFKLLMILSLLRAAYDGARDPVDSMGSLVFYADLIDSKAPPLTSPLAFAAACFLLDLAAQQSVHVAAILRHCHLASGLALVTFLRLRPPPVLRFLRIQGVGSARA